MTPTKKGHTNNTNSAKSPPKNDSYLETRDTITGFGRASYFQEKERSTAESVEELMCLSSSGHFCLTSMTVIVLYTTLCFLILTIILSYRHPLSNLAIAVVVQYIAVGPCSKSSKYFIKY